MIEYFSSNMWQLWLAVTLLCLVVELMSGDLFVACFAFGAFITIFAAALGVPVVRASYIETGEATACAQRGVCPPRPVRRFQRPAKREEV